MKRRTRFVFLLLGVAVISASGVSAWVLWHRKLARDNNYVEARIGDIAFIYNTDYARFTPGKTGGRLDSLELAATFPDMTPAGDLARTPSAKPKKDGGSIIFLSLGAINPDVAPSDRLQTLYARFLDADITETEDGLIRRSFHTGSPYQGEDLYFTPPEGRTFAARCARPAVPPDGLPETCIATFRQSGVDIDLRFDRALLPQWERLSEGAKALAQSMMAR